MVKPLNLVVVSGSASNPSRTRTLLDALSQALSDNVSINVEVIDLATLAPKLSGVLARNQVSGDVSSAIEIIESADVLLVGSPVYRASYTGLFKHLFDLLHHESLINVPVILAATGGSDRHASVIDHQLRPLFSFFQALTLPIGVYASEQDFDGHSIRSPALLSRIQLAAKQAIPVLSSLSSVTEFSRRFL